MLIAATCVSAALTTTPVVANAATPPVVQWAHSVSDDLGVLEVSATAEAGVTGLRAHIKSFATGQDVAVVDDFVLVSGTIQDGVWRTPGPVQLAELAFYKVVVDVTDGAGAQTSGPSYGSLTYLIATGFSTLLADPPAVTYADRSVRVSGMLTGKRPDTREVVPVPGGNVSVGGANVEGLNKDVMTETDGTFAVELVMTGPGDVDASFAPTAGPYLGAVSGFLAVGVIPAESRISLETSAAEVNLGEQVTVSGQLTWLSPDGWRPLANQQIGVLVCRTDDYCPDGEYPTADADGHFEVTLSPWETGYFSVGMLPRDPFIARATARTDITVWQPATFTDFSAAREDTGAVAAQGHIAFDNFTPVQINVDVQYQAPGKRTWTTVATAIATWDGSGGYAFAATVNEPRRGRWRASFAGEPGWYRPATSDTVFVR